MNNHYWNGVQLTEENWQGVLSLRADQTHFAVKYVKNRFQEGSPRREAARLAVQSVQDMGGEKRPAAYLNTPEVEKAIKFLADIESEKIIDELRPMAIKAISDRAFFRIADYFDENGDLLPGVTMRDFPPHLIDSIQRKPRGQKGPEEDIIEIKLGSRDKALDLIVKIIGIAQEEQGVNVNINNTVINAPVSKKRELLQKFQQKLKNLPEK